MSGNAPDTLEGRIKEIEKQLERMRAYGMAAVGVAAVFGLAGAYGSTLISAARGDIRQLEDSVQNVGEQLREKTEASINEINAAGQQEIEDIALELRRQLAEIDGLELLAMESRMAIMDPISQTISLDRPGLLIAAAYVKGARTGGGGVNSGVRVRILLNGEECSSDHSFEGESSRIRFSASAVCLRQLQPGQNLLSAESDFEPTIDAGHALQMDYAVLPLQGSP